MSRNVRSNCSADPLTTNGPVRGVAEKLAGTSTEKKYEPFGREDESQAEVAAVGTPSSTTVQLRPDRVPFASHVTA